jgi:hypothetical protein
MAVGGNPMAMNDFRQHVQTARNVLYAHLLFHIGFELTAEEQTADYDRIKRSAPIWLSPRVVAGFDPSEFDFFSEGQRKELAEAVQAFQTVADEVAGRPPTHEEVKLAVGKLMKIIGILDDHLLDSEGKALMEAVYASKTPFPDFILGIDYTLDIDATGDPGIWIWVIVPDDVDPDSPEFRTFSSWFDKAVRTALTHAKSQRIPYVHFRLLSEAVELMSEGVA